MNVGSFRLNIQQEARRLYKNPVLWSERQKRTFGVWIIRITQSFLKYSIRSHCFKLRNVQLHFLCVRYYIKWLHEWEREPSGWASVAPPIDTRHRDSDYKSARERNNPVSRARASHRETLPQGLF